MREDKTLFAEILDSVLLTVVLAAAAFIFARSSLSVIDSCFAGIAFAFSISALVRSRTKKRKLNEKKHRQIERTLSELTYAGNGARLDFFFSALSRFHPVRFDDRLEIDSTRIYCLFLPPAALAAACADIHEQCLKDNVRAVLIMPSPPEKATAQFIAGSDRLKVLSEEVLEKLLSDGPMKDETVKPKKRKGKLKRIFAAATDRKLFRRYLMTGALLIGTSYVLPVSPLYIAMGSLCLILALVCLLPKKRKKSAGPQSLSD